LTAHNGATGVNKIHAIGGTAAVSAAQLTAADAAGTIAGPVATITASPGQSAVTINFSQTVTSTTASLTTNYQIMGAATLAAVSAVTYTASVNRITLTLDNPLKTGDIVRINAGGIKTATGLSVGLTDVTVGYDLVAPTCTVYASTGNDDITITCDELVQQVGTLDTDVDTKVSVGGVVIGGASALGSTGAALSTASKTVAIDFVANFTSTGAAIVIAKDILKDLAGNKVGALTGSVITDTTKPTVVGLPTYTLTALTKASKLLGPADAQVLFVADTAGIGGNLIKFSTVDDSRAAATITVTVTYPGSGVSLITMTGDLDGGGDSDGPTSATTVAAVNAHATAKNLVTAYVAIGAGTTFHDTVYTTQALAGGTTRLTVSTTFSEAVVVSNINMIEYDVGDDASGMIDSATKTVVGSSVTSLWTLTGAAHYTAPAVNVDSIMYGAGITDLALNTLTAASPFLSAP
jgi:hypothetical protein